MTTRPNTYHKILVALDTSETDRAIINHVRDLAALMHSQVVLLHVADGWAARTYGADAVSPEITQDRAYLAGVQAELAAAGLEVSTELAYGDPATEIVRWIDTHGCDLVAMSTHGHRLVVDFLLGTTARRVQHRVDVPVLLLGSAKA